MSITDGAVKSTVRTICHYVFGSCSTAILMGVGDVVVQYYNGVQELKKLDWERTTKFSLIGFCFMGPVVTYWSNIVNSVVCVGKSPAFMTLKQLICDQIFLAPSLNLGIVTLSGVLNYESMSEIEKRISKDFPYIIKRHYMLWPAVQFFGQICIQPSLQLVFAHSIAIIWFAYISGILHRDEVIVKPMEADCKIFHNGLLMAAGDVLTQTYLEKCDLDKLDIERIAKFATIGFIFSGPLTAHWNGVMRKTIDKRTPLLTKAIKKTLNTQTFMAAPLNFGIINLAGIFNGVTPTKQGLENEMKGDFLTVMTNNYIMWLPTQFAGNLIRSSFLKFFAINTVSILWFAHLSSILMRTI